MRGHDKAVEPLRDQKAILYARVSSKEQEKDGYSIPAQQKLLTDYARNKSLHIVGEFVDVETAKAAGRTQFREMVKFLSLHHTVKTLLVEKTDRLYRNFRDYVTLDDLDLEIHLVKEGEVLSKDARSHVKFIHGIKVLMAKNYTDNLSEEVKKGHLEKAQQGGYPAKAPLGYRNNTSNGLVEVDAEKSSFVVRMFELAASGQYSYKHIRLRIVGEGLTHQSPKMKLSLSHTKRMLKNPFYTGSFLWNGVLYKGNHTPLISTTLFERAQLAMGTRHRSKRQKHTFAFSGLLVYGKCGCLVTAEIKKGRYVYYHCTKSRTACDEIYYREEELTPRFDAVVKGISISSEIRDWLIQAIKESHQDESAFHQKEVARLQEAVRLIKGRMDQMYLDKLDGKVSERFWMEKSREWEVEEGRIAEQLRSHQIANRRYYDDGVKLLELASRAHELYAKQPVEQKNRLLRVLLSNCTLQNGTLQPHYKKPFDILARGIESRKWGE